VRSLCGPQARLRTEQPVAGNEITARLKFARVGGKRRSAVPPPGGPKLIGPRACVQARRARNNAKNGRARPTRTERPVSGRAPLSTAWLARHSTRLQFFTIGSGMLSDNVRQAVFSRQVRQHRQREMATALPLLEKERRTAPPPLRHCPPVGART
jgi:hypothetical protein